MARASTEDQAEQLADKLLFLSDRRVALSGDDEAKLKSALKDLDSAQREIDLAVEAKDRLLEQQREMKTTADQIRAKQSFDDEKSILASAVADRKLELFQPRIVQADEFIAQARVQHAGRWWAVKTSVRFILDAELKKRTAVLTEVFSLIFQGINPDVLRTQLLPQASALQSLNNLMVDLVANQGINDTSKGQIHVVLVGIARSLLEMKFKI